MKKKCIGVVLAVLMLAAALSGCSKKTPGSDVEEREEETAIVYWTMWESGSARGKVIKSAAESYAAETGIIVQVEYKGEEFVRDGLAVEIEKGTTIDLFDYDFDYMNRRWADYLLDLEELAAASGYESSAYVSLMEGARKAGGGTLKSIPYDPELYAFFYNVDLFRSAGVYKTPATWEEFLDVCEKLKEAGITPITSDDSYIMTMFAYHLARLEGEESAKAIIENGEWEHTSFQKVLKEYEAMAQKGYFSEYIDVNISPSGQIAELAGGEAAMYLGSSAMPNDVKGTAGDEFRWGVFAYPEAEGGVTAKETIQITSKAYGINKNTKYAEEAFGFIEYMTKGEQDEKMSSKGVTIPADRGNRNWPSLLQPARLLFMKTETRLELSLGISRTDHGRALRENFQALCAGKLTAQEFTEAMKAISE